MVPTEEGNVVFEWIRPHDRIELEINFEDRQLELCSANLKTNGGGEELFRQDQWSDAFKRIAMLLS